MEPSGRFLAVFSALFLSGYGFAEASYGQQYQNRPGSCGKGVVACYYGMWAIERPGEGSFGINDIPTDLCTHVIYSFAGPRPDGTLHLLDKEQTIGNKTNKLMDLQRLKKINPNIKLMFAIGGWAEASANFSLVLNNSTLRRTLVDNTYKFVVDHKLDGCDLDWEYPAQRGGVPSDKEAFVEFLKELKAKFGKKLLVTAAVAVTQSAIDQSYDVVKISKIVDQIHLMTYDLHGPWESTTGINAPLFDQLTDPKGQENLSVNNSVHTWIRNGADASKMVVGVPNYGKSFTLTSLNNTSTGAPSSGPGPAGLYSEEAGTLSYYEICEDQKANASLWNITEVAGNYVYANKDLLWVGYDNADTAFAKGRYAKEMGLAGVMYWAVDLDDFRGRCGPKYPIISASRKGFCSC